MAWQHHDDFVCAICQREITTRWSFSGPELIIPPICNPCERWHSERVGKPTSGSFRDRREVRRGVALANALHDEAVRKTWRLEHGHA